MARCLDCCHVFMLALLSVFCSSVAEDQPGDGSPLQITALLGDDVILPCQAKPLTALEKQKFAVEWSRSDLEPKYVHVHRDKREDPIGKNPAYRYRTALFEDQLLNGNCSLRIFRVRRTDEGTYRCFLPISGPEVFIQLTVEFCTPCPSQSSISEAVAWALVCFLFGVLACDRAGELIRRLVRCFERKTMRTSIPERESTETPLRTGVPEEEAFDDSGYKSPSKTLPISP